jgi:hypothetical protein
MVENVYNDMLRNFSDTFEKTSEDHNKPESNKYMTSCQKTVVNIDRLKNDFVKNMSLTEVPKSCDALYMTTQNEFFMVVEIPKERLWLWHERSRQKRRTLSTNCSIISTSRD